LTLRHVDQWGRTSFDPNTIIDLLFKGVDISSVLAIDDPLITEYNKWCEYFDKKDYLIEKPAIIDRTPEEEHELRSSQWNIDDDIKQIDVRKFLLSEFCKTQEQIDRVNLEMDLYEERELIPLLQLMMFLVDRFRQNNVIWGVGRGSSVASYVLFLIRVHHIDSLKYKLDVLDFLK
jgi:DNA polymerase III alpha subunit